MRHAVERTLQATAPDGDRKVGVIWHTQGSGKSLLMAFYAGQVIKHPAMENPTLVVITDRNDLDDQLFGTFSMCQDLFRTDAAAGGEPRRTAQAARPPVGRRDLHDASEVLRRSGRDRLPAS